MRAGGDHALAGAGRRGQDDVRPGDDLDHRLLLRGVQREALRPPPRCENASKRASGSCSAGSTSVRVMVTSMRATCRATRRRPSRRACSRGVLVRRRDGGWLELVPPLQRVRRRPGRHDLGDLPCTASAWPQYSRHGLADVVRAGGRRARAACAASAGRSRPGTAGRHGAGALGAVARPQPREVRRPLDDPRQHGRPVVAEQRRHEQAGRDAERAGMGAVADGARARRRPTAARGPARVGVSSRTSPLVTYRVSNEPPTIATGSRASLSVAISRSSYGRSANQPRPAGV